jgi:hypothetical protein
MIAVENHLNSLTPQQLIQYALPAIQDLAIASPIPQWAGSVEEAASKVHSELFTGSLMRPQYLGATMKLDKISMLRGDERATAQAVSRLAATAVFLRESLEEAT